MVQNKVYPFLGLAARARKVSSGDETCERLIKSNKAKLVIVAEDASENTKKKFKDICLYRDVELNIYGEKNLLGRYIGKEIRSVIVVLDQSFAKRLSELMAEEETKVGGGHIGQN